LAGSASHAAAASHHPGAAKTGKTAGRMTMDRLPNVADLTAPELASLRLVTPGFMSRTIPKAHQQKLIQLGLIQSLMGGLMATPAGRMVGRN
jgi:hypothetical protein